MKTKLVLICMCALGHAGPASSGVLYNQNNDVFSGEDNSTVIAIADSGDMFAIGWKCMSDGLNVVLAHDFLVGDEYDRVSVIYKFDEREPSDNKKYSMANSNKATFFDMTDVERFTSDALSAKQVVMRITDPSDGDQKTATFLLAGLAENLSKLPCFKKK